jgi:hypothetical protein
MAMKTKLKGQSGVKGLLLVHGEKILMVAVAIAAGYLVYSALGVDRLPDQYRAEELKSKVQQSSQTVANMSWEEALSQHRDKIKIDEPLKTDAVAIGPPLYGDIFKHGPDRSVLAQGARRTDPTLLAALDVRAVGGSGLLGFEDPVTRERHELKMRERAQQKEQEDKKFRERESEANTRRGGRRRGGREEDSREAIDREHPHRRLITGGRGRPGVDLRGGELVELSRWVTVVAKVPIKNQMRMYRDAFENASGGFDSITDAPVYRGYVVQRAEVVPGQQPLQWQPVPVYDAKSTSNPRLISQVMAAEYVEALEKRAAAEWAGGGAAEVVDFNYLYPRPGLVYPLPPLIGREWGREATHPDIPLLKDNVPVEQPTTVATNAPATADAQSGGGFRTNYQPGAIGRTGREEGMSARERFEERASGRWNESGRESEQVDRTGRQAMGATTAVDANFYLLRFFDFTVEPGKRYKYRVQLVLNDPNLPYLATPNVLDPAVLNRLRNIPRGKDGRPALDILPAPWSEPSPIVGVPGDGYVRLASTQPGEEPTVNLLVEGFGRLPETGSLIQAAKVKEKVLRGTVANFVEASEFIIDEGTHVDRADKFSFTTGLTVLDMRGGEKLGRSDLTTPGRMILMGPTGGLFIRRELDDAEDVQTNRELFAKPRPGTSEDERSRSGR